MALFKCKMCGGDLNIENGTTVCECEYCGTKQTLPKLDDEKRINLYERANHFRRNNEFDKAMGIYEMILGEDNTDAEAYWSIVLCRYGIEYVDDPATHKKVPTVNRAQLTSIYNDSDYQKAIVNADGYQRDVYEAEAKAIDVIQKGILEISNKEEPFDVFICYKETDAQGRRTHDSVYAQDIYNSLTKEGYRVFFSRITLEDKIGTAYEPYIFAALNSAKVMLVVSTSAENMNAVWVKNEWSRYLAIVKQDNSKALIPCYKDMSPYDMPEEFAFLQAQDMGKIGFMQDLIHGVQKVISKNSAVKETVVINNSNASVEPLLKRAFMFLEDGDWNSADEYCEKVLDQDPENAMAYLGKLMVELKVSKPENLANQEKTFEDNANYKKSYRFADKELKDKFNFYFSEIEKANNEKSYQFALELKKKAKSEEDYIKVSEMFELLDDYNDSKALSAECKENAEIFKLEKEQRNEILKEKKIKKSKKIKMLSIFISVILIISIAFGIVIKMAIVPMSYYNKAVKYETEENYNSAVVYYSKAVDYKDAKERRLKIWDNVSNYWNDIAFRETISEGRHTVGLKSDGTVLATGSNEYGECNVSNWNDIVAVSTSLGHTVGLKSDGTVLAIGDNYNGLLSLSEWENIVSISTNENYTAGLKSDGTVIVAGPFVGNLDEFHDIIAITSNYLDIIGLKSDGTVVCSNGESYLQDISDWESIVEISTSESHVIGLRSDGTVVAAGNNEYGQCNVTDWNDIVAISTSGYCTLGLKSDGTVVATGNNEYGQCDISDWKNIVNISVGLTCSFGIKEDGTVVVTGDNKYDQGNISGWKGIKIPE